MIKVLLADDHKMFIDGLKAVLKEDPAIEIIGEALNGHEVMKILSECATDIVVLDIRMPEMNGIETTQKIKKTYPDVKVLILTMHHRKEDIIELIRIGAFGYILKNKSSEELLMAIHNIYAGKPHFGLEVLSQAASTTRSANEPIHLTSREQEVLVLIAEGKTGKEIAAELELAIPTVNTYRRNLLHKLEVPNEKFLVRYAIKHGFVEP